MYQKHYLQNKLLYVIHNLQGCHLGLVTRDFPSLTQLLAWPLDFTSILENIRKTDPKELPSPSYLIPWPTNFTNLAMWYLTDNPA